MKNVFGWLISGVLFFLSLGAFSYGKLSGVLFVCAALLCNPLVLHRLKKIGWKPKNPVILFLLFSLIIGGLRATPRQIVGINDKEVACTQNEKTVCGGESTELVEESASEEFEEQVVLEDANMVSSMEVHFIDVGQGDAVLIKCDGESMLIDAGDNSKGTLVQNYLRKQDVTGLKFVVGTHADADHYGGLDVILYKFNVDCLLLTGIVKDTDTCADVYSVIKTKNLEITQPEVGTEYWLGNACVTILGPVREYEDINDSSIVVKVVHGNNSFLFTGDCEQAAEADLVSSGYDLAADVYKAGHHGSYTSGSDSFLDAVLPSYCVISCGAGNEYGHPHSDTLNKLRERGISVYRTDEQGNIVAYSDGDTLSFNCAPSDTWLSGN